MFSLKLPHKIIICRHLLLSCQHAVVGGGVAWQVGLSREETPEKQGKGVSVPLRHTDTDTDGQPRTHRAAFAQCEPANSLLALR